MVHGKNAMTKILSCEKFYQNFIARFKPMFSSVFEYSFVFLGGKIENKK